MVLNLDLRACDTAFEPVELISTIEQLLRN